MADPLFIATTWRISLFYLPTKRLVVTAVSPLQSVKLHNLS